jgi:SnoaL-like polyketide cyclase
MSPIIAILDGYSNRDDTTRSRTSADNRMRSQLLWLGNPQAVVSGTLRGRQVRFDGITISRIENDLIAEDWSVTDTLRMFRQLGLWRALLMWVRQWQTARAYRGSRSDVAPPVSR